MRMFIAIELEPNVKKYLKTVQNKLLAYSKRGNFTDENNIHLTVKFIGDVSAEDAEYIADGMREAAVRNKKFEMKLSHLGFFPNGNRTIVWAGIEESKSLIKLTNDIEKSLLKQGFPRDKKHSKPHIILGKEVDLTERFDNITQKLPLEHLELSAKKLSLVKSEIIGGRLTYKSIFVQDLK